MRRSEWDERCKRHTEHRVSKGVCPYCLRDRLAHLSASSSATTTTRASSTATSAPYSSAGSPAFPPPRHGGSLSADVSAVHVGSSSSFANDGFSQPLVPTAALHEKKKGRREEAKGLAGEQGEEKKKGGKKTKKIGRFLSRLVGAEKRRHGEDSGGGGSGELFHSKTMKEKTASKWVLF